MEKQIKAIDFKFFIGCPCAIYEIDNIGEINYSIDPSPSFIEGVDHYGNLVISERATYEPIQIKPILRKLESLNREEVEHLNKLWSKSETTEENVLSSADIINFLTSIHIDIFQWIDKGFAIEAGNYNLINKN